MGAGPWGETVAVATSLQESDLENLTGWNKEGSHGLFGQRAPGFGWGTVAQTEDPTHAAKAFYGTLLSIPDWSGMALTDAAQAVQRSAFPNAYAKWQSLATTLVNDLQSGGPSGQPVAVVPLATWWPGLSASQAENAAIIIAVGQAMGAGPWGETVAVATALQESGLEDLMAASGGDSHGLFQQQAPGFGWGSVAQTEDPTAASEEFYLHLLAIPNWQHLQLTVAAQDVQNSAFPNAYAKWQNLAAAIVASARPNGSPTLASLPGLEGCPPVAPVDPAGYANPLRGVAQLSPERIDQGVDYQGSGPVYALGPAVVENVYNQGWPGGVFIAYQLTSGPAAGQGVYVAEGLVPEVTVGQQVNANTVLGILQPGAPGLETGWADLSALGDTEANATQQTSAGDVSTSDGLNFNSWLIAVGAPSGVFQG